MKNNHKIDEIINNIVINNEDKFVNESAHIYIDAQKKFDELLELGLAKKRGNNLLSIADQHLYHPKYIAIRQNSEDK